MDIGFIGFGEAAFNMAIGLKSEGIKNILAYDAMQDDNTMGHIIQKNAQEAGVILLANIRELVQSVNIIFVAVPSVYSLKVCNEIKIYLHNNHIYADVCATTPKCKMEIWNEIEKTGALFVDAAMMGSLPKEKHKVPITASGNGAVKLKELMTPYNMDITTAGEVPGAASAIKLIRSIYMKGVAALMIEMLEAAEVYGVTNEVIDSISKSMDGVPFTSHLDRLVIGSAIHCKRRADELTGSITLLEEANIDNSMTKSSRSRLHALERYTFAERYINVKPVGWKDVIEVITHEEKEVI